MVTWVASSPLLIRELRGSFALMGIAAGVAPPPIEIDCGVITESSILLPTTYLPLPLPIGAWPGLIPRI